MVLVTDDKADARNRFRAAFAPYYANPVYNNFLAWAGYADAAGAISEGWAAKDRNKTTGALSDALVDEIAIIGDEDECRERVRWDASGGVHTVITSYSIHYTKLYDPRHDRTSPMLSCRHG